MLTNNPINSARLKKTKAWPKQLLVDKIATFIVLNASNLYFNAKNSSTHFELPAVLEKPTLGYSEVEYNQTIIITTTIT